MLVHHTGKDGLTARGGYALECASDIVLQVEKTADLHVTVHFEHEKDVAKVSPQGVVLAPSQGSLVVTAGDVVTKPAKLKKPTVEDRRQRIIELCRVQPRTVDELASELGLGERTVRGEIAVLLGANPPRLTVVGTSAPGKPLRYAGGLEPKDTL